MSFWPFSKQSQANNTATSAPESLKLPDGVVLAKPPATENPPATQQQRPEVTAKSQTNPLESAPAEAILQDESTHNTMTLPEENTIAPMDLSGLIQDNHIEIISERNTTQQTTVEVPEADSFLDLDPPDLTSSIENKDESFFLELNKPLGFSEDHRTDLAKTDKSLYSIDEENSTEQTPSPLVSNVQLSDVFYEEPVAFDLEEDPLDNNPLYELSDVFVKHEVDMSFEKTDSENGMTDEEEPATHCYKESSSDMFGQSVHQDNENFLLEKDTGLLTENASETGGYSGFLEGSDFLEYNEAVLLSESFEGETSDPSQGEEQSSLHSIIDDLVSDPFDEDPSDEEFSLISRHEPAHTQNAMEPANSFELSSQKDEKLYDSSDDEVSSLFESDEDLLTTRDNAYHAESGKSEDNPQPEGLQQGTSPFSSSQQLTPNSLEKQLEEFDKPKQALEKKKVANDPCAQTSENNTEHIKTDNKNTSASKALDKICSSDNLKRFEEEIRLADSRFVQSSINSLVERYFQSAD